MNKQDEDLLKAYKLGFLDGVKTTLQNGLVTGLIRKNRKHEKMSVKLGIYLSRELNKFLKIKNNQKITLERVKNNEKA